MVLLGMLDDLNQIKRNQSGDQRSVRHVKTNRVSNSKSENYRRQKRNSAENVQGNTRTKRR